MVSQTYIRVLTLVREGDFRVSDHGFRELDSDRILIQDIIASIEDAVVIEDYPDYPKGPTVLVLLHDPTGDPLHAVWGVPKGAQGPAVLVTAYRPDPERWSPDFKERMP